MTAVNCIRAPNACYVLTDGAAYDDDGVLRHVGQKVIVLPWLRAVIAARGPAEMFAAIGVHVQAEMPNSFEDLVECLPNALSDIADYVARNEAEVLLAGLSFSKKAFESYIMYTGDGRQYRGPSGQIETANPFEMIPAPAVMGAPSVDPVQASEFGLDHLTPETFNPYSHGVALMQAQRRTRATEGGYTCSVGGFVLLNTITQYGVNSEIIHTWPDVVGEKLSPPPVPA